VSARRTTRARLLVVDDSQGVRSYLASLLELRGYSVDTADDGRSALALLEAGAAPDAVLLDVMMPGIDGLETLRLVRERHPLIPVLMLSVVGKAQTIVAAMQLGAADFLNKPFEEEELAKALDRVLNAGAPAEPTSDAAGFEEPYWRGATMETVRALLEQIADTDVTVLIQGESGVGKEIVARAVHQTSTRRAGPFVKVNCAALPGTLLESELFGYERGAFTGALARKTGKFEQAAGGTIFLDEIGEMAPAMQAKLLHVLQDGTFARLGGNREITVDARVVTATNRDLAELVARGGFREDLYFRINVVSVAIPPLRDRPEDRAELIDYLLRRASARYGRTVRQLSGRLLRALERHSFPGNVRELENLLKRVVVLDSEDPVLRDLLSGDRGGPGAAGQSLDRVLAEVERSAGELPLREVAHRASLEAERAVIERALYQSQWNRKQAARRLGVSYKTLLAKMRECGIDSAG
jgi:two-component system response regulator AtoC